MPGPARAGSRLPPIVRPTRSQPLKPTVANQSWSVYFVKVGDIPVGISIDVAHYGPAPVAGKWNTYTVPLVDLGVLGTTIYKFAIQDKTGLSNNTWDVDNVGFAP